MIKHYLGRLKGDEKVYSNDETAKHTITTRRPANA